MTFLIFIGILAGLGLFFALMWFIVEADHKYSGLVGGILFGTGFLITVWLIADYIARGLHK